MAVSGRLELAAVLSLMLILLLQAGFSIERISVTGDEHVHIPAGYSYWKTRDFRLNPEHPPLAKLVGGLPLQFRELSTDQSWPVFERAEFDSTTWEQWIFGQTFLFTDNQAVHDGTVSAARRAVLVFPLLLAICVYLWARMLFGVTGGLIALTLAVFNPDVLAHGRLVNTDAAMAAFYFVCPFTFWLYVRAPSVPRLLAIGIALGLGLASKYSNVLLIPVLGFMTLAAFLKQPADNAAAAALLNPFGRGHGVRRFLWTAANGAVVLVTAVFVLWAAYLFAEPPTLWLEGYTEIYRNLNPDFQGFMLGKYYEGRIWSYFLVTFFLKTPLAMIGLFLLGLWALWRHPRRIDPVALTTLILAPLVLFLAVTFKAQPIGHRYILGIYPYLFVIAGAVVWLVPERRHWRALTVGVVAVLLSWSAVAGLRAHPFYLAYHNALVPSDMAFLGYLNDSNNDWGQGWREVVRLQQRGELGSLMLLIKARELGQMDYRGRWVISSGIPTGVPAPGTYALRAFDYQPDWYRQHWPHYIPLIYDYPPGRLIAGSIVLIRVPPTERPERPLGSLQVSETFFGDGSVHQRFRYYTEDGEQRRSGPYELFHSNGELQERGNYHAGELTGPYVTFYENGHKREEGSVWRGQLHGTVSVWAEDGSLVSVNDYLLGQRVPGSAGH